MKDILDTLKQALEELYSAARPQAGDTLVVGCSTSEIMGKRIGSAGNTNIARELLATLIAFAKKKKLSLAIQCCEHLNRALVVEQSVQKARNLKRVHAIPQASAGGALASESWALFKEPVLVESIQAELGIDIGDTLIGMHLAPVAVPVRPSLHNLGQARIVMARTRPPFTGGERAVYDPKLT